MEEMDGMSGINVSSVDFSIMTKERKLEISKGEVKNEGVPTREPSDNTKLRFPHDGLFSEEIFGYSRDSKAGSMRAVFTASMPDRMKNFGHICLGVPYVTPYLYGGNGSKINLILGIAGPKQFKEIIEWRSALVRVVEGSESDEFFKAMGANKSSGVKEIIINAAYANKLKIMKFSGTGEEKMKEENLSYWSVPLATLDKNAKIAGKPKYKSIDFWNTPGSDDAVFMGSYAVLHLLSYMDLSEEIVYSALKLADMKKLIGTAKSENSKENAIKLYKSVSERYQILMNYKKRNLPLDSLATDILLVMPAGLRDITLRKDDGPAPVRVTSPINKKYSDILIANKIVNRYGPFISPEEILKSKGDIEWARAIPTKADFIDKARTIQLEINEIALKEVSSKVGKKKGRFRQTILSRRLDYTARAVITPDPELELDELGVPVYILKKFIEGILRDVDMATPNLSKEELLRFLRNTGNDINGQLKFNDSNEDFGYKDGKIDIEFTDMTSGDEDKINTIRELRGMLDNMRVLAIRFPSLHKYNLLGFRIKIVYDHTIHLHPLVCAPYNADFDGDQMSIYLVQTPAAIKEVDTILLPSKNLLNTNGGPLIAPSQDAILGSYYMTLDDKKDYGEIQVFHDYETMYRAFQLKRINIGQRVRVLMPHHTESGYIDGYKESLNLKESIKSVKIHNGQSFSSVSSGEDNFLVNTVNSYDERPTKKLKMEYVESTVGRFIFNNVVPQDLGFIDRKTDPYTLEVEGVLNKGGNAGLASGDIKRIISEVINTKPLDEIIYVLDMIKDLGYRYATLSGMSMSIQDIYTHPDKPQILKESFESVAIIDKKEQDGKFNKKEAFEARVEVWKAANEDLTDRTLDFLPDDNPIKMMSVSGSRGSRTQIAQLMGMRGLMADTSANIIETPVTSSFLEGLSMVEYFTASYGTRKGIFDRSNRTKETGETTRTSVYGTEKLVVSDGDCGDREGIYLGVLKDSTGKVIKKVTDRIKGKFLLEDLLDENGNVVVAKGMCAKGDYTHLEHLYVDKTIHVRSPLTCKHRLGLCAKCYGYNYGANRYAKIGDAAGVIASQTIGEPGTQLTMRTFHTGGVAKDDITQGFTMVRSLLETKKYPPFLQEMIAEASYVNPNEIEKIRNNVRNTGIKDFSTYGIANADKYIEIMTTTKELLQTAYQTQGINLVDTHYEVIARSMGTLLEVEDQGDSIYPMGSTVNWAQLESTNEELVNRGINPVIVKPTLNSLKAVASSSQSPFTAMTYQDINKILSIALTSQGEDDLTNPMSSVAVSNMLASGEGHRRYISKKKKKHENIITNRELMEQLGIPLYIEEGIEKEEVVTTEKPTTDIETKVEEPIVTNPGLDWMTSDSYEFMKDIHDADEFLQENEEEDTEVDHEDNIFEDEDVMQEDNEDVDLAWES